MKVIKLVDERLEETVSITLLAVMVIIVFAQVVARYVLQASLPWSEEVARYLFLWLNWMGAAWATKLNSHISIDILVTKLKGKAKKYVQVVNFLIWLSFAILLAYLSIKLTGTIFERGQVSAAVRMPMGFAYASVPAGVSLMVFRLIQNLIKGLRNNNNNKDEGGVVI